MKPSLNAPQVVGAPFGPSVYTVGVRKIGPNLRSIDPKLETPRFNHLKKALLDAFQVVGAPFGPSVYTLGVQKNGPYTRAINRAMLQLKQNGLLDELKKKWVDDQNVCTAENSVSFPS